MSAIALGGTDPRLFLAPDSSRGLLAFTTGRGDAYRLLERRPHGWTISAPHAVPVETACLGAAGLPLAYSAADHTYVLDTPRDRRRGLASTAAGRCAVGRGAILTQQFRQSSDAGTQTTTRLLDPAGTVRWQRVDAGLDGADLTSDGRLVALPTDHGLLVLDPDGAVVESLADVVDGHFAAPDRLMALHRSGVVSTVRVTARR